MIIGPGYQTKIATTSMSLTFKFMAALIGLGLIIPSARASLYLEFAFEEGGERMASSRNGPQVNAGGGLKFAAGLQLPIDEQGGNSLRLVAGYLVDGFDEDIGEVDLETYTFDAVFIVNRGPHAFGIGNSLHFSPEYRERPAGFDSTFTIDFDNASGLLLQYGYQYSGRMELGLRYLDIEYEANGASIDAGGFGVYLSNGF